MQIGCDVPLKISLIIPCYNEEQGIKRASRKILSSLDESNDDWEVIFVNDGSCDNTFEKLEEIAAVDSRVIVKSYQVNQGRGKALRVGFEAATGEIIVANEADLSWGNKIALRLSDALKKNPSVGVVVASPHLKKGGYRNVPLFREMLSVIGNKILCFGNSQKLSMVTGMTRAYRKEVLDSLELYSNRKELHLEIISKVQALGYKIMEIPAILKWTPERKAEMKNRKSSFPVKKLVLSHLAFTFAETPFLLVGSVGLLLLLFGALGGIYIVYLWATFGLNEGRPLIVFSVLLLLSGIQMLIFSFLASQNKQVRDGQVRLEAQIKRIR